MSTKKFAPNVHHRYLPVALRRKIAAAQTFEELTEIALRSLARVPGKVVIISGAISTGGFNDRTKNLILFAVSIEIQDEQGVTVFSQMPYEIALGRLARKWHIDHPSETYCLPILDIFYTAIFGSGKIEAMYFLPNWRSSKGARWEYKVCPEFGIRRHRFSPRLFRKAMARARIRIREHELMLRRRKKARSRQA